MKTGGTVRPATREDLDEIVALWSHYIRSHSKNPAYRKLPRNAVSVRRDVFADLIEGPDSCVFVVESTHGGLAGMLSCFVEANYPYLHPPKYGRLQTPFVRPADRKKGNLRRMLGAAYRWARELELTEVRLYTGAEAERSNKTAEDLGFSAIEIVRRKTIDWSRPPEQQVD